MLFTRLFNKSHEILWIAFGQIMVAVGGLVGIKLLTRYLSPHEYGELGIGMAVVALVNQIVFWPLSSGATRYYSVSQASTDSGAYLNSIGRLLMYAVTFVIFLLCLSLLFVNLLKLRTDWLYIAAIAFYAAASGCASIYAGILNASQARRALAVSQSLETWGRFLFATLLLIIIEKTSSIAIFAFAIISTTTLFWQYWRVNKNTANVDSQPIKIVEWKSIILKYATPFAVIGLFTGIGTASDRMVLNHYTSSNEVGLYVVLYQLGFYPMVMILAVMAQYFEPIIYRKAEQDCNSKNPSSSNAMINTMVLGSITLTATATLTAYLGCEIIFTIFTDKSYHSAAIYLPIVVASGGLLATGNALAIKIQASKLSSRLLFPKVAMSICAVLFNIVGANIDGLRGVVLAGLASSIVYLALTYIATKRL